MKWTFNDDIYLYDGSIEGFLTIVYNCLKKKIIPKKIQEDYKYEMNLLETPIFIATDYDKSTFIYKKIAMISDFTLYTTYTSFLCDEEEKEIKILKYLVNAFKYGSNINQMRNKDVVVHMRFLHRRVRIELHRFVGFLRFSELSNKILYAKMEPDNNIIELLAEHFTKRLPNENWIIHDLKRNILAVYDTKKIHYGSDKNLDLEMLKKMTLEDEYEKLWKQYFKNIGIKERKNKRCQLNFMPKKYWNHMLEVENQN